MINKIKNFFYNNKYYNKKYLIAVSGGVDSMVLLNIFNKIFNKKNIYVCNCNFNLKNKIDNYLILDYCYNNNIKFFFKKFNTLKFIKKKKISIQMGARFLRYNWFNIILNIYKIDYLILGHHIDDNIETLFINLLRGSSIYGLKGIKSINNKIIRPYLILKIKKSNIYKYAINNNIKWINDESNIKNIYLRNRVRNYIIPLLKKKFNKYLNNIYNVLYKLNMEYNIIKFYINKIINFFFIENKILNFNYIYIKNIKKIIKLKKYEYILYRFFLKYNFFNIKIFKILPYLKKGKIFYSNNKKYILVKDKNKLILSHNYKIDIKKKINNSSIIYINKYLKFFLKVNYKKNIKYRKKFIYLNFDLINFPIYIINWKNGINFIYNNKKININKIFKKFKISTYFKNKILLLVDKNNIFISSLNKILIYNNTFLINKKSKKVLYFNFLK
ncbi:MAG: tRNA lysidine(34) synthetase TilS [Candidatus Shikimatogenerans sp. JK-2022]|nr:tRNA lysidine(34) synthetase TilS [Candidatus Shikimatogenerans bostrichidophilus]